jgi:hypothetical protein
MREDDNASEVEQLRRRSVILEEMCGLLQEGRSWDEPVEVRLGLPLGLSVSRSGIVGSVHAGGNAERSGKIAVGDLVVSVDEVELCQGAVWVGDALDKRRKVHTVRLERLGDVGQLRHRSVILEEMVALLQEGREWDEPFTVRLRHPLGIGISRAGIVGEVYPGGNADRSGRVHPGDLVLSVDGNSLRQGKPWLGDALDTSRPEHDVLLQRLRPVTEIAEISEDYAGSCQTVSPRDTAQNAQVMALMAEVAVLREQISKVSPGGQEPPPDSEARRQVGRAAAEVETALEAGPIDFRIGLWDVTHRSQNESILAAVAAALRCAPAAYLHIHGVQNGAYTPDDPWRRRFEAEFPGELIDERASTAQGRALACRRRLVLLGVEGRRVRVTTRVSNEKRIDLFVETRAEAKERRWPGAPPTPRQQSLDVSSESSPSGREASGGAVGSQGGPLLLPPLLATTVEDEVAHASTALAAALAGQAVEFEPESWLLSDASIGNRLLSEVARVLARHPLACLQLHGVQEGVVTPTDAMRQLFAADFGDGIAMDSRAGLAQARALACGHKLLALGLTRSRMRVSVEISNQRRVEFEIESETEAEALRVPPPQPAPLSRQLEAASTAVAAALRARPVAFDPRSWDVDNRAGNGTVMAEVAITLKLNPAVHLHVHSVQARDGAALAPEHRAALVASFPGVRLDEQAPLACGRALACVVRLSALGVDSRRIRVTTTIGERDRLEIVAMIPSDHPVTPRAVCSACIASTRGSPLASAGAAEAGDTCRIAPQRGAAQGMAARAAAGVSRHGHSESEPVDAARVVHRRAAQLGEGGEAQQATRPMHEEAMLAAAAQQSERRKGKDAVVGTSSQPSAQLRVVEEAVKRAEMEVMQAAQAARRREEEAIVAAAAQQSARRRGNDTIMTPASQRSAQLQEEEQTQQAARQRQEEAMVVTANQHSARRRAEEAMTVAAVQQSARRKEAAGAEAEAMAARTLAERTETARIAAESAAAARVTAAEAAEMAHVAAQQAEAPEEARATDEEIAAIRVLASKADNAASAGRQSARWRDEQGLEVAPTQACASRMNEPTARSGAEAVVTAAAAQTSARRMNAQSVMVAAPQLSASCDGQDAALDEAAIAEDEPTMLFSCASCSFPSASAPVRSEHKSLAAAPQPAAASAGSTSSQAFETSGCFSFAVGGASRRHLAAARPGGVSAAAPGPAPALRQSAEEAVSHGSGVVKTRSAMPPAHFVSKPSRVSEVERQSEVDQCTEALQQYLGIQPPVQRDMRRMIVFKGNSSDVADGTENSTILSEVARILAAHPNTRMLVRGETDNRARADLARLRAKACLDGLVEAGIAPSRLQSVGRIGKLRRVEFLPL